MNYNDAVRGTEEQFNIWKKNCIETYINEVINEKELHGVSSVLHRIGLDNIHRNIEHEYGFKLTHDELIGYITKHWMV